MDFIASIEIRKRLLGIRNNILNSLFTHSVAFVIALIIILIILYFIDKLKKAVWHPVNRYCTRAYRATHTSRSRRFYHRQFFGHDPCRYLRRACFFPLAQQSNPNPTIRFSTPNPMSNFGPSFSELILSYFNQCQSVSLFSSSSQSNTVENINLPPQNVDSSLDQTIDSEANFNSPPFNDSDYNELSPKTAHCNLLSLLDDCSNGKDVSDAFVFVDKDELKHLDQESNNYRIEKLASTAVVSNQLTHHRCNGLIPHLTNEIFNEPFFLNLQNFLFLSPIIDHDLNCPFFPTSKYLNLLTPKIQGSYIKGQSEQALIAFLPCPDNKLFSLILSEVNTFSGNRVDDVDYFVYQLERSRQRHTISDSNIMLLLPYLLRDTALFEWCNADRSSYNWPDAVEYFGKMYGIVSEQLKWQHALQVDCNSSPVQYVSDCLHWLCRIRPFLSELNMIHIILARMNPDLKAYIGNIDQITTVSDLVLAIGNADIRNRLQAYLNKG